MVGIPNAQPNAINNPHPQRIQQNPSGGALRNEHPGCRTRLLDKHCDKPGDLSGTGERGTPPATALMTAALEAAESEAAIAHPQKDSLDADPPIRDTKVTKSPN